MRRALNAPQDSSRAFYLPHHGVVRDSSSTTKLRVVFNGSQNTNLGHALNDDFLVGPKVQTDLADVLLRWRQYPVAFSSDIVKIYRQILVHEDDQDLQRILWREEPELPIEEYRLTTVTYGLASAPYLAIRVLHQLVQDEGQQYPPASPHHSRQHVCRRHSLRSRRPSSRPRKNQRAQSIAQSGRLQTAKVDLEPPRNAR